MKHKITIRALNTLGNQLPQHSPVRKIIHEQVLEAVEAKVSHILLDDEDEVDIALLKGLEGAKILEKKSNKTKRTIDNQTPYMSVKEYILRRC